MRITRAKVVLIVIAMVANTQTKTVETKEFKIPKVDDKKIQKEIEKQLPENLKFVAVESKTEAKKLFGLDEAEFMAHAIELDPKTRKPLKADGTVDTEDTEETEEATEE